VTFDFAQIVGSESSRESNFSSLCNRLLLAEYPEAQPVEGKGGDEGLDTFLGDFDGACEVFQHKYFLNTLSPSQRRQVKASLQTALGGPRKVRRWVLMIPKDLTPAELRWFANLKAANPEVEIVFWGKTKLQELLAKHADVARDFSPTPNIVVIMMQSELDIRTVSEDDLASTVRAAFRTEAPDEILNSIARELKARISLRILLWGPGTGGGKVYEKRAELKEKLTKLGHVAHFSEDVCTSELLARTGLNLSVAELIQAQRYDYVICLMASPGSIGEVHDFARIRRIAVKMMICIDQNHKSGYSGLGVLRIFEGYNGKVDWFSSPTDLTDCHLATRVLDQIHKVAETKQWELSTGRLSP